VWERGVSLIPSSSHQWSIWSPDSILIDGHACSLQKKETKSQSKPLVHHACIRRMMLRLRSSLVDAQKGGYQYGIEVLHGFQILTPSISVARNDRTESISRRRSVGKILNLDRLDDIPRQKGQLLPWRRRHGGRVVSE